MKKKSKKFVLMFYPESNGKSFTLRVHKYTLISILTLFIIFIIGLVVLIFRFGEIAAKLQLLHVIKAENEVLSVENSQLCSLSTKIENIEKFCRYIENIAVVDENNEKKDLDVEIKISYLRNNEKNMDSLNEFIREQIVSVPNITPVEGWITRQFSTDSITGHQGVDFAAARGTPIRATAPGIVDAIESDKYLGLVVTIKHENGYLTRYGHCSQILISKRERVNRGQTIALVGNTGRSTAPHLHYEVLKDEKNINPSKFLLIQNE